MNNFEIKKRIVLSGNSRIFNDWSEHSSITMEEFIEALEWVCNDPLNGQGKMTREIGLSPTGIVKLFRANREDGLCFFYKDGELWGGEVFTRKPTTEKEKKFCDDNGLLSELHKICISCKDKV